LLLDPRLPGSPQTWVWKVFIGKTFGMVTWDLFGFFEATKGLAFPIYLAKL